MSGFGTPLNVVSNTKSVTGRNPSTMLGPNVSLERIVRPSHRYESSLLPIFSNNFLTSSPRASKILRLKLMVLLHVLSPSIYFFSFIYWFSWSSSLVKLKQWSYRSCQMSPDSTCNHSVLARVGANTSEFTFMLLLTNSGINAEPSVISIKSTVLNPGVSANPLAAFDFMKRYMTKSYDVHALTHSKFSLLLYV